MLISSVKSITISSTTNKCTFDVTCFYGRTNALVRCRLHRLMEGVHGFIQSYWMLSLGELSRCISNEKKITIVVRYQAHHLIKGGQGYD